MLKKSRSKKNLFLTLEAPPVPGVYSFFNSDEKIIYVGQSKNLRRRLGQYKNAKRVKRHSKMRKILSEASRLEYEVCASPLEAEILETQLIQRLRPKWNVMGAFYFLYPMIGMRISNG